MGHIVRRADEQQAFVAVKPLNCTCAVFTEPSRLDIVGQIMHLAGAAAVKEFSYLTSYSQSARVGAKIREALQAYREGDLELQDGKLVWLSESAKKKKRFAEIAASAIGES